MINKLPVLSEVTIDSCSCKGKVKLSSSYMSDLLKNLLKASRGKNLDINRMFYNQLQETIYSLLKDDLDKKGGKLFGNVNIDLQNLDLLGSLHSDVNLNITYEVFPQLPDVQVDKIKIENLSVKSFSDEDIKKIQSEWLKQKSYLQDSDKPIAKNDVIKTSWSIEQDDQEQEIQIQLGVVPRLDKDLENKFLGLNVGDIIDHEFKVPAKLNPEQEAEYGSILKAFAGQTITGKIKIKSIQTIVTPELSEEFLKEANFDSEESFKASLIEKLGDIVKEKNAMYSRDQLLICLRQYDFDIPNSYLEQNVNFIIKNWCHKFGIEDSKHDDSFKETFMSRFTKVDSSCTSFDHFLEGTRKISKQNACAHFMVEQLIPAISLTEEDLNNEIIKSYARFYRSKNMQDFQNTYYELRESSIISKFIEYLNDKELTTRREVESIDALDREIENFVKTNSSPYTNFSQTTEDNE